MNRAEAMAYVATNGPKMAAALAIITDRSRPDHPMSIAESEAKRADGVHRTAAQETAALGEDESPSGAPAPSVAAPTLMCGQHYDADVCVLPFGHDGECQDELGNGIEIPF